MHEEQGDKDRCYKVGIDNFDQLSEVISMALVLSLQIALCSRCSACHYEEVEAVVNVRLHQNEAKEASGHRIDAVSEFGCHINLVSAESEDLVDSLH